MRTRPEIDLARGILMASFRLSAQEAREVLVMASRNTSTNVVTHIQGPRCPTRCGAI